MDQGGLHRGVGTGSEVDLTAGDAADRDDRRRVTRLQVRHRRADHSYGPHQIDLEGGPPAVLTLRDCKGADVGYDDVDTAQRVAGGGDPGNQCGRVDHVDH